MLMFYLKETPFKMSLRDTIKMNIKQFGSRSDPTFFRPDLCPNCLQRVSTDDKNRPYQDTFIANSAHETSREHSKLSHMKCASMFFCHQVSVHNNCHLN